MTILAGALHAQTNPTLINFSSWPANGPNTQLKLNQNSPPTAITIYNINKNDLDTLLKYSTISGTLNGKSINETPLSQILS